MKNKLTLWMMAILVAFIFAGCSSDSNKVKPDKDSGVQNWLVDEMSRMYLWNNDVKAKNINYAETDYRKFFTSLLSTNREDGRHGINNPYFYSYIEETTAGASGAPMRAGAFYTSLGADYFLVQLLIAEDESIQGGNIMMGVGALIRTIIEGSPLWEKGLRRGDYIISTNDVMPKRNANGEWINLNEFISPLLRPTGKVDIIWGHPVDKGRTAPLQGGGVIHIADFGNFYESEIVPAVVEDNPVYKSKVVTTSGGKKVGYIAYKGFERGEDGFYDDKLKDAVRALKSGGATELVLDLRYNGGGYLSSCQLLTSMILKESMVGTNIIRMTYNDDLVKENDAKFNQWLPVLSKNQMKQPLYGGAEGDFLGMTKLYVITSAETASASEALIHSVKGIDMPVHIIGMKTEGKNVGMTQRLSDEVKTKYDFKGRSYEAWPVTLYIKDAKDQKYTAAGFSPDYMFDELNPIGDNYVVAMEELGDPKEKLFAIALRHIDNGSFPAKTLSRGSETTNVRVNHSVKTPERPNGIRVGAGDFPVEQ